MTVRENAKATSTSLRRDINARNLVRATNLTHELTFGEAPCIIYQPGEDGGHGNFLTASYRRIAADPEWAQRLAKTYTSSSRVPRSFDRKRGELECASSSDALLMNIFCYPGLTSRWEVRNLLCIDPGLRPSFGVRAQILMRNNEVDRTELDMRLGPLNVEAKLTETSFGTASKERLFRYVDLEKVFNPDELPWNGNKVLGYQLIRGVLAAHAESDRFVLLCDSRRADLMKTWFHVLRAVRSSEVRSRMTLLYWQELAATCPPKVRTFLAEKYGIEACSA
jgi:hypothetical protein